MSEYTREDVIVNTNDKRVKVGELYYPSDNPIELIKLANAEFFHPLALERVDYGNYCPFVFLNENRDKEVSFTCLIKAKKGDEEE